MISQLASNLFRARPGAAHFTVLLGLAALAFTPAARASLPDVTPSTVVTNDTYSIEVLAYNTVTPSGDFYAVLQTLTPKFGTTQTFANDALGGQTLTVTSSESTTAGITTDNIAIGVPTNFIPTGTVDNNGNIVNALEFSIGNYNIPTGGTANTLDFNTALTAPLSTGSATFNFNGITTSVGLTQNPVLSNGNKSYSNEEAVQSASTSTPISSNQVTAFSFTITYAAVPEPSTYATMVLGAGALFWVTARRRARRA